MFSQKEELKELLCLTNRAYTLARRITSEGTLSLYDEFEDGSKVQEELFELGLQLIADGTDIAITNKTLEEKAVTSLDRLKIALVNYIYYFPGAVTELTERKNQL